jgi:ABC-2 type transport system ATP-binding protein
LGDEAKVIGMASIEVAHLSKSFADHKVVDDLSLVVEPGEIYGLVGPDGAGKTTTIRLICGALRPTLGLADLKLCVLGNDLLKHTEQARSHIGYLPQRFSMYEELTVLENIRFFAETRGLKSAEWQPRCMEILNFVGLAEFTNRRAGQLSGGMKQKLGLAVALVHRPAVLLLDEPTTGVDPVTRQDFWQLIIHLIAEEGVAMLISTPYMDEAARCTHVGFMQRGKLIVEGTPTELRHLLDDRIVEIRGKPLPQIRSLAQADEDVEEAQMFGDRIHLRVREGKSQSVIARLQKSIPENAGVIDAIRPVAPQLEDVFISLLENGE